MCTDHETIRQILADPDFEVMDYSQSMLAKRLGISLDQVEKMLAHLPLAREGEDHKWIRKRHAVFITESINFALDSFRGTLQKQIASILLVTPTVDLVGELIKPSVYALISTLAGVDRVALTHGDSISQIFDETLSISKRINIDRKIGEIINSLPDNMSDDEKYFRIAMVALATDSLIGTLSESLSVMLKFNQGIKLSDIRWDEEPPATGTPVIERILRQTKIIADTTLLAGQRVRLYVESAGYSTERPAYAKLYFGAGPHVCLGMSLGKQTWKIMTSCLSRVDRSLEVIEVLRRGYDNVFNGYNCIKTKVYD
jgi:cytochrome P450